MLEHGGSNNFVESFNHQTEGVYRPETVVAFQRMVRIGRVSMETCVEMLELVDYDRKATDAEMQGYALPDVEGEALPPLPQNPNYERLYTFFNRTA